jgi:rubrerythrin
VGEATPAAAAATQRKPATALAASWHGKVALSHCTLTRPPLQARRQGGLLQDGHQRQAERRGFHHPALKARPSPPRFGRKLTAAQKARATHICLDCGFIYFGNDWKEEASTYECPQCNAPKSRFAEYDAETGKTKGGGGVPALVSTIGLVGLVGTIGLIVAGLNV